MLDYKQLLATIDGEIGAVNETIRDLEGTIFSILDQYKEDEKAESKNIIRTCRPSILYLHLRLVALTSTFSSL